MATQKPYVPVVELARLPAQFEPQCQLCQNIAQSVDATNGVNVKDVALYRDDRYAMIANRYPQVPLASLFLPISHDDFSKRSEAVRVPDGTGTVVEIRPQPGKTRDNVPSWEDLDALFSLCDQLELVAFRNHALDGKSIATHDHWHVLPYGLTFTDEHLRQIVRVAEPEPREVSRVRTYRTTSLPHELLVVESDDLLMLVSAAQDLISRLENENQVFTLLYTRGTLVIAPRHTDRMANRQGGLGASPNVGPINVHDSAAVRSASMFLPLNGDFDWRTVTNDPRLRPHSHLVAKTPEEILARYNPIDYSALRTWGPGDIILPALNELEQSVWRSAFPYQDKRNDPGQAEVVTYFGLQLAQLFDLSESDTEVVVLACILHDTGFGFMPNINEQFRGAIADKTARGIANERDHPELWQLRIGHQKLSCDFAKTILADHPRLAEILEIVGDHNTRDKIPSAVGKLMRDADHLWRVHLASILANTPDPAIDRASLKARLLKSCSFHTDVGRRIAEIETENSLNAFERRHIEH